MKLKKNILAISCLSILASFSSFSYAQDNYNNNNNRGNFRTGASDYRNAESYQRNLIGECDSACELNALTPPVYEHGVPDPNYELTPPAHHTEERTRTCQEEGYPSDWLGRVLQRRAYITQNGVRITSLDGPWVTYDDNCRAPYPCTAQNVNWNANGNSCSGPIAAMAHNTSNSTTNTLSNRTGTGTFSCNDGTLSYTGTGTCYAHCPGGTQSWVSGGQTCSGNIGYINHNAQGGVSNTLAKRTGSATFSCNNGNRVLVSGSCTYIPDNCSGQVSWNQGSAVCRTNLSLNHGDSRSVSNTLVDARSGTASFTCNDGVFVRNSSNCRTTEDTTSCRAGAPIARPNGTITYPGEVAQSAPQAGGDWGVGGPGQISFPSIGAGSPVTVRAGAVGGPNTGYRVVRTNPDGSRVVRYKEHRFQVACERTCIGTLHVVSGMPQSQVESVCSPKNGNYTAWHWVHRSYTLVEQGEVTIP